VSSADNTSHFQPEFEKMGGFSQVVLPVMCVCFVYAYVTDACRPTQT